MNFTFLRLAVLIILQLAGLAQAATLNFNGGAVAGCTYSGQTYSCATLPLVNWNDGVVIAGGYTVVVSSSVVIGYNQSLQMSGGARLQTSGNASLDLSQINPSLLNASGTFAAGGNFLLGAGTVTGTVTAGGQATVATGGTITGPLTAASLQTGSSVTISGAVAVSGVLGLGSGNTIGGAVSGASISTSSNIAFGSSLTVTGAIDLGSGNTISGAVSGASITSNANVSMGSLSVTGAADLGSKVQITGSLSAGTVTTNSNAQIGGAVISAGAVDFGSGVTVGGAVSGTTITTNSQVTIGGAVTATTSFSLGSGGAVTGDITAPVVTLRPAHVTVNGNITASTSLEAGSGTTITGNISGGSLTLRPSNVTINGNATFTGDVDMGSGDTINGDLSARNVTTHASNATINGNAAVNAIYLDWGATVTKTITCTGAAPGAPVCSCVTKADSNYHPTCGAAPVSGAHHIQISHSGYALTCQPQTVTLTACANQSCTAPHYSADTAVTLQPGGKTFTVSGGVNSAATVEYGKAETVTLSATSNASNGYTCINSGDSNHPCDMKFETSGLTVTAPNHISMEASTVTIQALTASGKNQSCVPLVASKTVSIDMSCTYNDPVSGTVAPALGSTSGMACDGGTKGVQFAFDAAGIATVPLTYADVGKVDLKASYTSTGGGTAFSALGAGSFIAAPKEFQVVATNAVTNVSTAANHDIFAKASEAFTVKVTAVNAAGNAVKNFGKEKRPEGVSFAYTVPNPTDAGSNGTITQGEFLPFDNGVYSSKSGSAGHWSFSDVGTVRLKLTLANASNSSATTYYMGYSLDSFVTKGELDIARFIPDHFDTVLMTNDEITALAPTQTAGRTMSCTNLVAGVNPCTGSSTNFTHSKQPFFLKVLAYNGASTPTLTSNYAGSLAKPVTLSVWTAAGGATAFTGGTLGWTAPNPPNATASADPKFAFTAGTGIPYHSVPTDAILPYVGFASAYPAADILPATIYLRAVDADSVSSQRTVNASSVEAPLTVVSGRLMVANAYGSQNSPLPIEASAQYYMPSGYVFNSQVNAVSAATVASKIAFSKCQKALDVSGNGGLVCPGSLKAVNTTDVLTLVNGKGRFRMAAPTPTLTGIGTADVSLGLIFDYLPSSTGRETFGIYRSGPVIYTREVHN
jgi:MSHA biogenesis protein MshQ